jgi:hypothetical protein
MPWRRIGGVKVYLYVLLASAVGGGEWSASCPGQFVPGERTPSTSWIDWLCFVIMKSEVRFPASRPPVLIVFTVFNSLRRILMDNALKSVTVTSFHIIPNSSFTFNL